jgi:hypothetical protein
VTFYRLRQTDVDGTSTYSSVVVIEQVHAGGTIHVTPNPTIDGRVTVTLPLGCVGGAYQVLDAWGRNVLTGAATAQTLPLDLSGQPTGIYLLRLGIPGMCVTRIVRE